MAARKPRSTKGGPAYVRELAALAKLGKTALLKKYEAVFGRRPRHSNVRQLRESLARRLAPAAEPAPRAAQPPATTPNAPTGRDARLPAVGSVIARVYEDKRHEVTVVPDGFVYRGCKFRSLSMVAREITGTNWNGFVFFGLGRATRAAEEV